MRRLAITFVLFSIGYTLSAQCPVASFDVAVTSCIDTDNPLENITIEGDSYEWDLCGEDIASSPDATLLFRVLGWDGVTGLKLVEDVNGWYGFVASGNNNKLFRLYYGTNIENPSPVVTDLGNVGGFFNKPEALDILYIDGGWHGIVTNFSHSSVVKLDFGTSLSNTPTGEQITIPPAFSLTFGSSAKLVEDNGSYFAFIVNRGGNSILRLNFGTDIMSTPVIDAITATGVSSPRSLSMMKTCAGWEMFFVATNTSKVHRFSFTTLDQTPTKNILTNTGDALSSLISLRVVRDFGKFYLLLTSGTGNFYRGTIGTDISNNAMSVENLGNLGVLPVNITAFDIQPVEGAFISYVIAPNKFIYKIKFMDVCPVADDYLKDEMINSVQYTSSGTFGIELLVTNSLGEYAHHTSVVNVQPLVAPDIDFTTQNICATHPINFSSQNVSGNIASYAWDFGDTNTSSDSNPDHTYAIDNSYPVTLSVTAINGCTNFIRDTLTVYPKPIPSFNLPSGIFCTNNTYLFENTTPGDDFDGNITWQWEINSVAVGTNRDLTTVFSAADPTDIKLTATLPGCVTTVTQNIPTVNEGAIAAFSATNACHTSPIAFNDESTGGITDYHWDFGDGNESFQSDPNYTYATPGNYDVTLTITNAVGCESFISDQVAVHALPNVQFSHDLSCELSTTLFTDETTIPNGNSEQWQWYFDDPVSGDNTSSERNPSHTFTAEDSYTVKLIVTSNYGCIDSLEQAVAVLPAPVAAFGYDKHCLDEITQFTDQSEPVAGQNLTAWVWQIGEQVSLQQDPQVSFDMAADYPVSLTVTAQNQCTSTIAKTLTVYPKLTVDFDYGLACNNAPISFENTTASEGDVMASYTWDFDGEGTADSSEPDFSFPEAGIYDVNLTLATGSGCTYNVTKPVVVHVPSQATFSPSVIYGAYPLTVDFINETTDIVTAAWNFDDGDTSDEFQPTHVFQEESTYEVQMVATDVNGCETSASQDIRVLFPELDIELTNLTYSDNMAHLTIANIGTVVIEHLTAVVDLGRYGQSAIQINERILPQIPEEENMAVTYTLDLPAGAINPEFICITLETDPGAVEEEAIDNNSKCINPVNDIVVVNPYPNPAYDDVFVRILSGDQQSASIQLYDSKGGVVLRAKLDDLQRGLNELSFNVKDLNNGLYILKVQVGEAFFTRNIVVKH